jgi:hypothetical protein
MSATRAGGLSVFVEFIRMSLYERPQPDVFEQRPESGGRYTREQWLKYIFSTPHEFPHRGSNFTYVPDSELSDDSLVTGRIGRQLLIRDNEPPEQGMHEQVHQAWQASVVVIDPRHHEDGQKAVMQSREEIGKPIAVFQSLISNLNGDTTSPYTLEAFGIRRS